MKSLIIYCFPHYGIVDNNYELIKSLIKSNSVEQVVIACPSLYILGSALQNSSLRSQLIDLNASFIVCFFDACWLTIPFWRILNARRLLSFAVKFSFFERLITRFFWKYKFEYLVNLFASLTLNCCFKSSSENLHLSDVTQFSKRNVHRFFESINATSIISVPHGVSLPGSSVAKIDHFLERHSISWTVYLYTPLWIDLFQRKYNLASSDIFICGIPKHWPLVTSCSHLKSSSPLRITLCSRPYTQNHYLLKCQKIAYLKELRKFVLDNGNILTIKLHPGEKDTGIYLESLGSPSPTNRWSFTTESTSQVSERTDICILFYSGTCVDFIARGVPCIERSNLEDCPGSNLSTFFRGSDNRLISPYSKYGLVEHAYDSNSLSSLLSACIMDSQEIAAYQFEVYQSLFPRLAI